MKKFLTILLAALMLVSATACGNTDGAVISGVTNNGNQIDDTFVAENGTFTYEYVESTTIRITGYTGKDALHDVTVNAVMNEKTVIGIADGAFYSLSNIRSVTLPDTVTEIGKNAFAACKELTSVSIPASITTLGENAFYRCAKLQTVTFTNTEAAALTVIPASAFNDCQSLSSITLPATVKTVGDAAFFNCASLTELTVPTAVESVGVQAFQNCSKLQTITFGDQITVCGAYAFEGCDALTNLVCPVLTGWNAVLNQGTDDEESYPITFASVEDAIEILTNTYYKYTFIRTVEAE